MPTQKLLVPFLDEAIEWMRHHYHFSPMMVTCWDVSVIAIKSRGSEGMESLRRLHDGEYSDVLLIPDISSSDCSATELALVTLECQLLCRAT
jgi:hypothetical protein